MPDWVVAVERAYVEQATRPPGWKRPTHPPTSPDPRALAAIGAVASRYLAVGTPRTLGLVVGTQSQLGLAKLSIEAHSTWFSPRELRCAVLDGSKQSELPTATLSEALAADIVCLHVPITLEAGKLRRGTHVNVLATTTLIALFDDELGKLATISRETPDLGRLAAGLVDGRQLDEITVFVTDGAAVAIAALGASGSGS